MRLTSQTDYALRVLLFAGSTDHSVTINTIAQAFGISKEHLRKVVHALAQQGYLHTTQGRSGGITLGKAADQINIADVVGIFESDVLVECFDKDTNTCPILGMCGLKHALLRAQRSFMDTLGQYYLSDMLANPRLAVFVRQHAA